MGKRKAIALLGMALVLVLGVVAYMTGSDNQQAEETESPTQVVEESAEVDEDKQATLETVQAVDTDEVIKTEQLDPVDTVSQPEAITLTGDALIAKFQQAYDMVSNPTFGYLADMPSEVRLEAELEELAGMETDTEKFPADVNERYASWRPVEADNSNNSLGGQQEVQQPAPEVKVEPEVQTPPPVQEQPQEEPTNQPQTNPDGTWTDSWGFLRDSNGNIIMDLIEPPSQEHLDETGDLFAG